MTAEELCEYLRIHKSTLYRMIKTGKLPYFRMGSDYRFSREAIDEWRRSQEVPGNSASPPSRASQPKT